MHTRNFQLSLRPHKKVVTFRFLCIKLFSCSLHTVVVLTRYCCLQHARLVFLVRGILLIFLQFLGIKCAAVWVQSRKYGRIYVCYADVASLVFVVYTVYTVQIHACHEFSISSNLQVEFCALFCAKWTTSVAVSVSACVGLCSLCRCTWNIQCRFCLFMQVSFALSSNIEIKWEFQTNLFQKLQQQNKFTPFSSSLRIRNKLLYMFGILNKHRHNKKKFWFS